MTQTHSPIYRVYVSGPLTNHDDVETSKTFVVFSNFEDALEKLDFALGEWLDQKSRQLPRGEDIVLPCVG